MTGYRKTLDRLVDFVKALSAGSFVASFVGFFLQKIGTSWALFSLGALFFLSFLALSIFYDRRFSDE